MSTPPFCGESRALLANDLLSRADAKQLVLQERHALRAAEFRVPTLMEELKQARKETDKEARMGMFKINSMKQQMDPFLAGSPLLKARIAAMLTATLLFICGCVAMCTDIHAQDPIISSDPPLVYFLGLAAITSLTLAAGSQALNARALAGLWVAVMFVLPLARLVSFALMTPQTMAAFVVYNPSLAHTSRLLFFAIGVAHSQVALCQRWSRLCALWMLVTLLVGASLVIARSAGISWLDELRIRMTLVGLPFVAGWQGMLWALMPKQHDLSSRGPKFMPHDEQPLPVARGLDRPSTSATYTIRNVARMRPGGSGLVSPGAK